MLPILAAFVIGMLWFAFSGAYARESRAVTDADAKLSRYYYFEGQRQEFMGNTDAAYECYKRSVAIDPQNEEASYALGSLQLAVRTDRMQSPEGFDRSLQLMRGFVNKYPQDFDEGLLYGYMAGYYDTTGEAIRVLERLRERYPDRTTLLVYLSQAYQSAGDISKAVDVMNVYEKNEGKSAPVSMHKISLLMEAQDTTGALKEADLLVDSDPSDYTYRILKGNLFDVLNMPDSAETYYLQAEKMAPEASSPKMSLMEIYRQRGDSIAYDNKVYEVLMTEDMQPEEKTGLLAQYLQKLIDDSSDTRRGDTLFNVLEKQYPHEPALLTLSARYKWAKKDTAGAIDAMSYAVDTHPNSPENWQTLIYYQANAGDVAEAIETFDRADKVVELPENMKLYKGILLNDQKRYDEAMDIYRGMIHDIDSGINLNKRVTIKDVRRDISMEDLDMLSTLFQMLGDCYVAKTDTLQGFDYFETSLEMNPDNTLTANNYAYFIALTGGDLDKALQLSEQSLKNEEANNPTNLDTLAWIYFLKGDYGKAYEIQTRVMELMKEQKRVDPEAQEHYKKICEKIGKSAENLE